MFVNSLLLFQDFPLECRMKKEIFIDECVRGKRANELYAHSGHIELLCCNIFSRYLVGEKTGCSSLIHCWCFKNIDWLYNGKNRL